MEYDDNIALMAVFTKPSYVIGSAYSLNSSKGLKQKTPVLDRGFKWFHQDSNLEPTA